MSSQNVKKLYDAKKNNHSMRERLRIWLLEHPELNPYRFSVGLTLGPNWYKNPNKFSIGHAYHMVTSSILSNNKRPYQCSNCMCQKWI